MPLENDKEDASPHALPSRPPGKLQIDGVRILFKFARQREDEGGRGRKRDGARGKFAISKYFSEKGRAWRKEGEGGEEEEDWRDLNPLASSSHPGAIVILIRLFVISPPLIRPNSPCFHNASLSPFPFLPSGSLSLFLSRLVTVSLKRCQIGDEVLSRTGVHTTSVGLRAKKLLCTPTRRTTLLDERSFFLFRSPRRKMCIFSIWRINSRRKAAFQRCC